MEKLIRPYPNEKIRLGIGGSVTKKSIQHTHKIKSVGVRNKGTIHGSIGTKQGSLPRAPNIAATLTKMVMSQKLQLGKKLANRSRNKRIVLD